MRNSLSVSLSLLMLVGSMLAGVSPARAYTCPASCGNAQMACTSTMARQFYLACRSQCLDDFPADAVARKSCVTDCQTQLEADRTACFAERDNCATQCSAVADEFCAGEVCGRAYNQCRKAVREATKDCIDAAGDDNAAIQACIEPGDVMQNTGRAALADCRTNATTGLNACLAGC